MTSFFSSWRKDINNMNISWKYEGNCIAKSKVITKWIFINIADIIQENDRWSRTIAHNFIMVVGMGLKLSGKVYNRILRKLEKFHLYCIFGKKVIRKKTTPSRFMLFKLCWNSMKWQLCIKSIKLMIKSSELTIYSSLYIMTFLPHICSFSI